MGDRDFTPEQDAVIHQAGIDYYTYLSDGLRCDYCSANCNCDADTLEELVEDVLSEFPDLEPQRDYVEDCIRYQWR